MASILAASRHLTIPRSRVKFTGVTLGNGAYGKVSEVEYDGKWELVKPGGERERERENDW